MPQLRFIRPRALTIAIIGAVAFALTGLLALPDHPSAPAAPSERLATGWQRGVALTDWSEAGLGTHAADQAIDDAMAIGADRVVLSPTLYMADANAAGVEPDPTRTAGDPALRDAIAAARARGLSVTLKPHVDVADDRTPRTEIAPDDPAAWFSSYRLWLVHYARLAQQTGADTLVLGVELSGLQDQDTQWRDLASQVRRVFTGQLTYAANWDALDLRWWDAVDLIGVDAYMPLTATDEPTDEQLAAGWAGAREQLAALHAQWNKPLLLTEIGYPDTVGAAAEPWAPDGAPDPAQQAQAVKAAFTALSREPWLAGAYWWDWPVDDAQSSAYSLRGSPAADVLRAWQAPSGGPVQAALLPDSPGPLLALALVGAALAAGGYLLGWVGRRSRREEEAALARAAPAAAQDTRELERVLMRTLRAHDADTADHAARVGALAAAVAGQLDLPADETARLRRLGELHDVGKLRIPLEILLKPGRLNPDERAHVRRWGEWSAELIAHVPDLAGDAPMLERACRLDDSTPLPAQVIAACDAFDSMTHRRPFRPAIQRRAVLAALAADRRLDKRIVQALDAVAPAAAPEPTERRFEWAGDLVATRTE